MFEARALYRDGVSLEDVLDQARGVTDQADTERIKVQNANGEGELANSPF